MRIIKKSEINTENFMPSSVSRAKKLSKSVKVDYSTDKRTAFTVEDLEKKTIHSVLYNSQKEPPADWNCDCRWHTTFGMNGKYCAHILAVNTFLGNEIKL